MNDPMGDVSQCSGCGKAHDEGYRKGVEDMEKGLCKNKGCNCSSCTEWREKIHAMAKLLTEQEGE